MPHNDCSASVITEAEGPSFPQHKARGGPPIATRPAKWAAAYAGSLPDVSRRDMSLALERVCERLDFRVQDDPATRLAAGESPVKYFQSVEREG